MTLNALNTKFELLQVLSSVAAEWPKNLKKKNEKDKKYIAKNFVSGIKLSDVISANLQFIEIESKKKRLRLDKTVCNKSCSSSKTFKYNGLNSVVCQI